MSAGRNEKRFINLFRTRFGNNVLEGKKVFRNSDSVEISVDNSFRHGNLEFLIEIDSGNMAKLLAGQYTLLNELYTGNKENCIFVVIHTYKKYNPERTTKNLALINSSIYQGKGIRFFAMHISELEDWVAWKGKSLNGFISKVTV